MTPEPDDGALVVLTDRFGAFTLIWRNDAEARAGAFADERWFDDPGTDPMAWDVWLRAARSLRIVGKPESLS